MRILRVVLIVLICLLETMFLPAEEERKPKIELRLTPKFAFAPARITALVLIENGGEKFYCPSIAFEWADGNVTTIESDCDPYSGTDVPQSFSRSMVYGAGEHTIRVNLSKGGRVLRGLNQTFEVMEGLGG